MTGNGLNPRMDLTRVVAGRRGVVFGGGDERWRRPLDKNLDAVRRDVRAGKAVEELFD